MSTDWFRITAKADHAEVMIYDRIGSGFFDEGVEAKGFARDLAAITASTITLRINSPGGSVFDGQAIAAAIARHPATVTAYVDGLAASIATVVALAADRVVMNDNALWMIHDPRVMADGTADDMRSAAELLDRVTNNLVDAYTAKTGQPADTIRAAMAAETWYTAAEAFDFGFVDQVTYVAGKAAASFDLTAFGYRPPTPAAAPAAAETLERITVEPSTVVAEATDSPVYATAADLIALERQIAAAAHAAPARPAHPLAGYKSIGEYAMAVYSGEAPALPLNAAPDQITTDNPGVIPPNWTQDVKRIVDFGRPGITAMGVESAGADGMDFNWPYSTVDVGTIVAAQSAQKAALNTVLISILKGTANLTTYGAYSDISYQLLQRSSPAYLDAHNRLMLAGYAATTDNVFVDALVSGGVASSYDYDLAADTTGADFKEALFTASVEVESATGAPASVVLVATDVFLAAGGWSDLTPLPYGTQNVSGTATANTLNVNVNGLPVIHDRNLASGSIIVTNPMAASWIEAGPQFASAEVVSKLGRDVAVYGYGCTAIYVPNGVRKLTNLP